MSDELEIIKARLDEHLDWCPWCAGVKMKIPLESLSECRRREELKEQIAALELLAMERE